MKSKFILLSSAMLLSAGAFAQSTVSTGGKKHVVIEESTGVWCGYCPDGAAALEAVLDANPNAIGVSIHDNKNSTPGDANVNDAMEIADGYTYIYTPKYCNGYPNGSIDRVPNSAGDVGLSRNTWASVTASRLAVAPNFDIEMSHTWDKTTQTITITIKATTLADITGKYNVNVYVTEDKIESLQANSGFWQHSYLYTDNTSKYYQKGTVITAGSVWGLSSPDYYHNHVVRAMLGGTWGTTGVISDNSAKGKTYTKTYTYVVPSTQKIANLKLVGLVQKNSTSATDRAIDNGIQATFVPISTNVETAVDNVKGLEVYPNPANNNISVKATVLNNTKATVSIVNTIGQTVFTQEYTSNGTTLNANISIENLRSGVYSLNVVSADGSTAVQKIVVSK